MARLRTVAEVTSTRLVLDDIDDIAVELACDGQRSGVLNRGERHEAIRRMNTRGYSDELIAHHIGCTARTVLRDRQALGIPAVPPERVIDMADLGLTSATSVTYAPPVRAVKRSYGELLEDASAHGAARVRNLGSRIENDLEKLRALLALDDEKAQVRAEVERLERELAAAKAKLRGRASVEAASTPGALVCDCGKAFTREGWLERHRQACQSAA